MRGRAPFASGVGTEPCLSSYARMQWLMNLPPLETYLIAVPSVMLGAILFLRGIILLLETWHRNGGDGARFR
jgi:hypothetical protein